MEKADEGTVAHVLAFFDKARDSGREYDWWAFFLELIDSKEGRIGGPVWCAMRAMEEVDDAHS